MRGLLVKDFYMTVKTQWTFFFISIVMLAFSFDTKNPFFLLYPAILCGMIPGNLMSFDERIKWHIFSDAFPYSRKQAVSSKYLVGLIISVGYIILAFIVQLIYGLVMGRLDFAEIFSRLSLAPLLLLLPQAITLPAMFKFGSDKGRIAIYVMVGILCGTFVLFSLLNMPAIYFGPELQIPIILALAGLFTLSWFISIKLYEKRDF